MKKNWIIFALSAALLLLPEILSACPNCKEAYAQDGQSPIASGFSVSIYFMMAMPFLVFGAFVLRLWLAQRRRGDGGAQA